MVLLRMWQIFFVSYSRYMACKPSQTCKGTPFVLVNQNVKRLSNNDFPVTHNLLVYKIFIFCFEGTDVCLFCLPRLRAFTHSLSWQKAMITRDWVYSVKIFTNGLTISKNCFNQPLSSRTTYQSRGMYKRKTSS